MRPTATPVLESQVRVRPKRPRSPNHYPLNSVLRIQRWWRKTRFSKVSQKIHSARSRLLKHKAVLDALQSETQEISSLVESTDSIRVSASTGKTDSSGRRNLTSRAASILQMLDDEPSEPRSTEDLGGLKAKLGVLEMEKQENYKTVESLKLLVERMRQELKSQEAESERRIERALGRQKAEFDDLAEKNITFTESLLSEKEQKNKLLTELQRKLKETEQRTEQQLTDLKQSQAKELKKNKDAWAVAEKLRREAWIKEKTKEIKEMTARGLEPEIMRLIAEQKQALEQVNEEHRQALSRQKTELGIEFEETQRKMRENWGRETDQILERERETYSKRIRETMEKQESEIQTMRRRAAEELAELRRKYETERDQEIRTVQGKVRTGEEEMRRKEKTHEKDLAELREELGRRHNIDLQKQREQLQVEKDAWVESQLLRLDKDLESRSKQLRAEMIRQRDAEIASIIQKLGSEHLDTKKMLELHAEKQVSALKAEQANELGQYQVMVENLKGKLESEMNAKKGISDSLETLGRRLQELETQTRDAVNKEAEMRRILQDKEAALKRVEIDQEKTVNFAVEQQKQRTKKAESDLQELKARLDSLNRSHEEEIERMRQDEAGQMEALEERVKSALRKKEETIRGLKDDLQTSQAKVGKLEEMLERQRVSLLQMK